MTARVKAEARRLGFSMMRVAKAGPLPWKRHFDDWLAFGMHGEMSYLSRQAEKRRDPALVLDQVRSILTLAMNYYRVGEASRHPLQARISRYAWGDDYHRMMRARLCSLADYVVRENPGAGCVVYADTGPVMEKVWGAHAGLGWMGKHSNLLTREAGSWFFTGVILVNFEMEADAPGGDYCGTCERCLEACPTGAIVAPRVVDARLCISYLTIELRGSIPPHLRPRIGNRIFGCDDCQDVCPWNRFSVPSPEPSFLPRRGIQDLDLLTLASITDEEFEARFQGSPIRRARRDGLVRNVAVALGNSRMPEAIPALLGALQDASPLVRGHAAWALGRIGTASAVSGLEAAARRESDPFVLEEIRTALSDPD